MKKIILIGCIFLTSCYYHDYTYENNAALAKTIYYVVDYDIDLVKIVPPKNSKKSVITNYDRYTFEDDNTAIVWKPTGVGLFFSLRNKSDSSIKIIWDETVFIDENNSNHRVIHSGIKISDRNNAQPPTVIIKDGKVEDMIYPADYTGWVDLINGGNWYIKPILTSSSGSKYRDPNRTELTKEALAYIGKTIQVSLALEQNGSINEYLFTFEIKGASLKEDSLYHSPYYPDSL